MLRRSHVFNVHLFTALLPTNLVKTPKLIEPAQLTLMKSALEESNPFVTPSTGTSFLKALEMCQDVSGGKQRAVQAAFDEALLLLRSELNSSTDNMAKGQDPFRRLQIHECIMAGGFYQRAANPGVLHGEGTRFVLHHFNFDLRRDLMITNTVHDSVQANRKPTPQSDKLLTDVFLLERKLFGNYRFVPTGGKRWFCLGVSFEDDIKNEEEVRRLLELGPVKDAGAIQLTKVDNEKELWYKIEVEPKEEPSFITSRGLESNYKRSDCKFVMSVNKPPAPLTFWERLKERLLRYWVIWISCWIVFFMVDEEIIALTSLIVLKWKAMRNMKIEAEKSGEKMYVARAKG